MSAKRKAAASPPPAAKRRKGAIQLASEPRDVLGGSGTKWEQWPAPLDQLDRARAFIRDCAEGGHPTILVPDKDADGLSSALVIKRTLVTLGLAPDKIHIHLPRRGIGLFSDPHRESLEAQAYTLGPPAETRVIVVDQGSRPGRALVRDVPTLIIDHHVSKSWPEGSIYATGCDAQPVPTSSLLAYITCWPLHPDVPLDCDWVALIGVAGDLGVSEIRFGEVDGEWPVSKEMLQLGVACKRETKKGISEAVALLNAPRRTAEFNVIDAWNALSQAKGPKDVSQHPRLQDARERVRDEHARWNRTPPIFSKDGRCALLRIDSGYQIHPLVATSWSNSLKSKKLQMVMVANPGHHPDPNLISFSCRVVAAMRKLPPDERPNLIELLREYGANTSPTFLQDVGADFASGHREATGGIINKDLFEAFCADGMQIGVKPDPEEGGGGKTPKKAGKLETGQRTLAGFFSSPAAATKLEQGKAETEPVQS